MTSSTQDSVHNLSFLFLDLSDDRGKTLIKKRIYNKTDEIYLEEIVVILLRYSEIILSLD